MKLLITVEDKNIKQLSEDCIATCSKPELKAKDFEHTIRNWLQNIIASDLRNNGE